MSTKRNHRQHSKSNSTNISSVTSKASSSEPPERIIVPRPVTPSVTPSNVHSLLGADLNVCSASDDFGTDYFNELFDTTLLPTTAEHDDLSKTVSLPDDSLGISNIATDANFLSLTAQEQASLDDPCQIFSSAGRVETQAPSNTSLEAAFLAPPKNPPLSIQSLEPSLQYIHNNSESLFRFPYLLPIINIIATTEAHLQRASIPIDEAMCTNKACMSQISRTMEDEEFIKCNSCSLLIATAMQMVITLYEKALFTSDHANSGSRKHNRDPYSGMMLTGSPQLAMSSSMPTTINNTSTSNSSNNDQQHLVSSFSARRTSSNRMPSLQFGVFQFEPEEPLYFRNQIIRKELQRCIEIFRACHTDEPSQKSKLLQTGASAMTGGFSSSSSSTSLSSPSSSSLPLPPSGLLLAGDKVRKTWLVEMERRANALIASLPIGGGGSDGGGGGLQAGYNAAVDAAENVDRDSRACQRDRGRKRSIEKVLVC